MRVLVWIGAVALLLIALLFLLRLRLTGVYGESGASLTVSLGTLPLLKLPRSPGSKSGGTKKRKTGKKKKEKKKKTSEEEKEAGGSEPGFRKWLPIIKDALGMLKARLSVDEFTLWYLSASKDPAAAALAYGGANAAAAALARPVRELFRVKKCDLRASVSFTETKPKIYARLSMSLSLGILIWLGVRILIRIQRSKRKAAKKAA